MPKNQLQSSEKIERIRIIPFLLSLSFFVIGIVLLWFGLTLSSDPLFFDFVKTYLKDLRPTPAMLEQIDYKIFAIADIFKKAGLFLSIISFILAYLILKGFVPFGKIKIFLEKIYVNFGGKAGIRKISFIIGASTIFLCGYILILFSMGLKFFGITMTRYHFPLALGLTIVSMLMLSKFFFNREYIKMFVVSMAVFVFMFLISFLFGNLFYDTAFDSLAYHQEIIIRLTQGWDLYSLNNPLHTKDFINSHTYTQTKAAEICSASLVKFDGLIESGKIFNFLMIFSSFFIAFYAATVFPWISIRVATLISALLAFNPVSVYQSASYYIDGQLSSILLCLFSLAVILLTEKKFLYVFFIFLSIIIASNLKLTGLVYSFVVASILAVLLFFREDFKMFFASSLMFLSAALIAIFLVGFNPYVTNHIYHGHIFYPFFCKNPVQVIEHAPPSMKGKNQIEKAFASIFSECENFYVGHLTEYSFKFPLFVSAHELTCFANTDTRASGFGPLFAAMFIVSLLVIFSIIFIDWKTGAIISLFFLWILASGFIITEPWWARFVPQIYFAPISTILVSYKFNSKVLKFLRNFLLFLAIANILLISMVYYTSQYATSASLERQLKETANSYKKIYIYFPYGTFASLYRLKSAGIDAVPVDANYFKEAPQKISADFFSGFFIGEKKENQK